MRLCYDDDFVEAAAFLCASGRRPGIPSLQIARFHREREKPYAISDPDERNAAFFRVHLEWFREWGLEQLLTSVLAELPGLRESLDSLAFRQARRKGEEGAELYVKKSETDATPVVQERNSVVALRIERLARDEDVLPFLRHEFMHVNDMVSPAFGYSPQIQLPGLNQAQHRLTRDRYRLLWDMTIDGRLARAKRAATGTRERHRTSFDRVFSFWSEARRGEVFDSLWNDSNPRHDDLLAIACDPRAVRHEHQPLPGAPCPLCGFATFNWATPSQLEGETGQAIAREFPAWSPEQGACSRCVEVYEINQRQTQLQVV
jgi:hypothetical protein